MDERYLTSFADQESALSYTVGGGGETLISPQVSLVGSDEVVYSKEIPHESRIRFAKDEETGKLYFVVDGVSYVAVDLGLPSGLKWANMNVGAETPQDRGLYFDWGNIDGHVIDENGNVTDGYSFDENTYATTLGCQYTGSTLDSEHDAATVNMGSDWRMPTRNETVELVENTDKYYIDLNGNTLVKSELDSSKLRSICFVKKGEAFDYNNRTNFIEIPFAGRCDGSLLVNDGLGGYVWSSSITDNVRYARDLNFSISGYISGVHLSSRCYGFSVRGVRA